MLRLLCILLLSLALPVAAIAGNGMTIVESAHPVSQTADRLEAALKAKGMTVFNRIDHAAGAAKVGQQLRPTELVIFGNPKIGSRLMQCDQGTAIDLPMKALIYEGADGKTRLAYNSPVWLASRHDLAGCQQVLDKVAKALHNFAAAATAP